MMNGLSALEAALARDFDVLNLPAANWVPERAGPEGKPLLDVLVVGGGMCGVTAAFHLRRMGIHNIRIIDAAVAGLEGPWRTFARMETLRSPKHLTGPASGLPNLTFRAWWEAQHGAEGWAALGHIPRETWADYMAWFGRVTGAGVESGRRLMRLMPCRDACGDPAWSAELGDDASIGVRETVTARFIVLASGREGLAVPRIPPPFAPYRGAGVDHSGDAPPRSDMQGRDVAVIGLGASAFDYAAEALEGGARHVRIIGRSERLARVNKAKSIGYAGFVHGFSLLRDDHKLAILELIFERGIAPPRGTVQRVMRHPNVELVLGAPVADVTRSGEGRFKIATPHGIVAADRIVLGTGYRIDLTAAEYLEGCAGHIRTWRDVLGEGASGELLDFPYLGPGFEFQPRGVTAPAGLERLLSFNHAAMLSLGNLANDIPAVSEGADRLARHVAAVLFRTDFDAHMANLRAYEEPELMGDEVPGLASWWPEV